MTRKKKNQTKRASAKNADRLMDEAFEQLEDMEPEKALAIGRRLEKQRYPGGFEIQALALRELDRDTEAIRVLEKGIGLAPEAWPLWQLLGNLLSDAGRYDDALKAYETGLEIPGANAPSLRFNQAMALWRAGRLDDADALIADLLADPDLATLDVDLLVNTHAARIGILCDLGRAADAVAHYDALARSPDWQQYPDDLAQLAAKHAQALWLAGRRDAADAALAKAIRLDKRNESAQWLAREMRRGDQPSQATAYGLMIHGPWEVGAFPETLPSEGFYVDYQVVAEDLDEALQFIRQFEPPEIRDALKIEEVLSQEPSTEPKGVYWTSGYMFISED